MEEQKSGEESYLALLQNVMCNGEHRQDRTSTGTLSLFAPPPLTFDLQKGFPLYTTKKVFFRGIFEELLFFIRGQTDAKILQDKGIHIWDGNTTSEFLNNVGLPYQEGEMGPMYGFQWRSWGASYPDNHGGFDQLHAVVKALLEDPTSRRIVMSSWNVSDLDKMCLNPCHVLVQFYVSKGKQLDCHMYQRSCDLMAGNPWNVAGYALLTTLLAHITGLIPGNVTLSFGDAHIYKNHLDAVKIQVQRLPRPLPNLVVKKHPPQGSIEERIHYLEAIEFNDLLLTGYDPHPKLNVELNA